MGEKGQGAQRGDGMTGVVFDDTEGFAVIPRSVQRARGLSWKAKAVYLAISSRANGQMQAWPSHSTIAEDASIGVTAVKGALAELLTAGLLTVTPRARDDGGQSSSIYTLGNVPTPSRETPTPQSRDAYPPRRETPTNDTRKNDTRRSKTVHAHFDAFWGVWPDKRSKPAALKAFEKAVARVMADESTDEGGAAARITTGAARFRDDPNRPSGGSGGFMPHAATWLNNDRWDDPPYSPRGGSSPIDAAVQNAMGATSGALAELDRAVW